MIILEKLYAETDRVGGRGAGTNLSSHHFTDSEVLLWEQQHGMGHTGEEGGREGGRAGVLVIINIRSDHYTVHSPQQAPLEPLFPYQMTISIFPSVGNFIIVGLVKVTTAAVAVNYIC